MGYVLQAIVGKEPSLQAIASKYSNAKLIAMGQGIAIIPVTGELYNEMNEFVIADNIEKFMYLNTNTEKKILQLAGNDMIAYVEADYFGGHGRQCGIIWKDGIRIKIYPDGPGVINHVLRAFGGKQSEGMDEFDTLGFYRHRNTSGWVE